MATEYLRNRPFLAVEVTQRVAPNVNTKIKGWMNEPGAVQSFEKVSFLDRVNNAEKYSVIIDVINSNCVVNKSTRSENEVLATYLSKYKNEVTKALTVWAEREAHKMALEDAKAQIEELNAVIADEVTE